MTAAASTAESPCPPDRGAMIRAQLIRSPSLSRELEVLNPIPALIFVRAWASSRPGLWRERVCEERAASFRARTASLAAHVVGPSARPARPLADGHRDRGHRPRTG